jgi:hypothetical protein
VHDALAGKFCNAMTLRTHRLVLRTSWRSCPAFATAGVTAAAGPVTSGLTLAHGRAGLVQRFLRLVRGGLEVEGDPGTVPREHARSVFCTRADELEALLRLSFGDLRSRSGSS